MCDRPFALRYRNLFLRFNADFAAFAQQGVAEIHRVFQDALDCGVVPQVGCPRRAFGTEIVAEQDAVFERRDDAVRIQVERDFARGIPSGCPLENTPHDGRGLLVGGQAVFIRRVLAVAIGRTGAILSVFPVCCAALL